MENDIIKILLVEDNKDFAKLVQVYLQRHDKDKFSVCWKENYTDTMAELLSKGDYDIILMDYFLPGKNGLEITKELKEKKYDIPVVFLTVNKDFELAVDVMKLGVDDYLVKEEISSPVLPKTVISIIEKRRLKEQIMQVEISQKRLQAVRETLSGVLAEFERPIFGMKTLSAEFQTKLTAEDKRHYVKIIDENINRMIDKLEKLKSLKVYKTIKYIKDIKMIDLS